MKRLKRKYNKLETLSLYSLLPNDQQLTIGDPKRKSAFFAQIDSGLDSALNEGTLHGIRVQTMFPLMVASLGKVRLIKQEDAGECYYRSDEQIQPPDFKVVQTDGKPILIEVKNNYKNRAFGMREKELDALACYSSLLETPLKIAIYWAKWNIWTLNDPRILKRHGSKATLEFGEALCTSEMSALGDVSIGTEYPLMLRIPAATDKPRSINAEGRVNIQTAGLEFYSAGQRIEDELEKASRST